MAYLLPDQVYGDEIFPNKKKGKVKRKELFPQNEFLFRNCKNSFLEDLSFETANPNLTSESESNFSLDNDQVATFSLLLIKARPFDT